MSYKGFGHGFKIQVRCGFRSGVRVTVRVSILNAMVRVSIIDWKTH